MTSEKVDSPSVVFAPFTRNLKRSPRRRNAALALFAAALAAGSFAAPLARAAQISESYIGVTNGDWNTAANWSSPSVVPVNGANTYAVTVNNIGTVYYDVTGSNAIDTLDLTGTGLSLDSGDSLTVNGSTTLTSATVTANSATFGASDVADFDFANLTASGSGTITLSGATSYTTSIANVDQNLTASGASAQLTLAAVTQINVAGDSGTLLIQAEGGGTVNLSGLTTLDRTGTRGVDFQVYGTNSTLNIGALGPGGIDNVTMDVQSGGTVLWGTPTTFTNSNLIVTGAATIDTSGLTDIDGSNVTVSTDNLANVGGSVSLPALTSFTTINGNVNEGFESTGTSSQLTLGNLTTINLAGQATLYVEAYSGGTVDLSNLTTLNRTGTRGIDFQVYGAGSTLKIAALGAAGIDSVTMDVESGGTVLWGTPTTFTNSNLIVTGAATIDTSGLTDIDGSNVTVSTDNLANVGGSVSLPALTSFTTINGNVNEGFESTGTSSQLTLGNLTTINLAGQATLYVEAYSGGTVDLSNLTTLNRTGTRGIDFQVYGAGSTLKIAALGAAGIDSVTMDVESGGTVLWGTPTTFTNSNLIVTGAATIDTSGLTDIDGSNVTVSTDNLANVGGSVSLPALTSFTTINGNVNEGFESTGTSSQLTLGNLTTINLAGQATLYVEAYSGGTVDLSNLTTLNRTGTRGIDFQVYGAGSTLKIAALGAAGIDSVTMDVESGGTVLWGTPTTFTNSNLIVTGAATIDTSGLTDIDGSNVTVSTDNSANVGGSVTLPAVTAYTATDGNVGQTWRSTGAGSLLSLPALTTLHLPGSATVSIQADSGGTVSLSALTTFDAAGGTRTVTFNSFNANSMIVLTSVTSMPSDAESLDIQDHGSVEMGAFSDPFTLHFRAYFANSDGDLDVYYNGTQIADIAPNNLNTWETYDYTLNDPSLPFGPNPNIEFNAAGTDAVVYVDEYQATEIAAVPEPASLALLGLGAVGILASRKRRHRAKD